MVEREWVTLRNYLARRAEGIRYIFSPFVQTDALANLVSDDETQTIVVTRWNRDDLAAGVSDPRAFSLVAERGWTLKVHPRLHLKAYCWNLTEAIAGSANVTSMGLGLSDPPNEEYLAAPVLLPPERQLQLARILREATVITERAYRQALEWTHANRSQPQPTAPLELIFPDKRFLTSALPVTGSPADLLAAVDLWGTPSWQRLEPIFRSGVLHDLTNYGLTDRVGPGGMIAMNDLREAFFRSPFIEEIEDQLTPSIQFGRLKQWIQENCTDVPVPSRRDLTGRVQVLLRWFCELAPENYRVDVPGSYSERLIRYHS